MTQKILGQEGSKRRKRFLVVLPFIVFGALLLAISGSAGNSTLANFEIDGDLYSGTFNVGPTAIGLDWIDGGAGDGALICPPYSPGGALPNTCPVTAVVDNPAVAGTATFFRDPLKVDPDPTTFTQGDKENDFGTVSPSPLGGGLLQASTPWHIVSGSVPPQKDDLFDVLTYTKIAGGEAELDLAALRTNNNGSSHLDFELNKVPSVPCVSDANTLCPTRTEGDFLVSFEISPGSITQRFFVWDLPGGTNGGGKGFGGNTGSVDCVGPLSGQEKPCPWEEINPPQTSAGLPTVVTAVNTSEVPAGPWGSRLPNGTATTTIPPGGWFEASLDLDGLGFAPSCPGFGQASAKSRSSDSLPSALMDLAGPFPIDLNTCGKITIIKDAVPNDAQDFSYATTSTGSAIDASFSLDDDADGTLSNTKVFSNISPGTYTFTEGDPNALSPKWDLTNLACTKPAGDPSTFTVLPLADRKATVNLGNLGDVTCTFTNTKRGSITIIKDTVPNGPTDFAYTSTSSTTTAIGSFSLDDDTDATLPNTRTFGDLLPGAYSVTETLPVVGFDLTGLLCTSSGTGTSTSTTLATGLSSITLGAGGSATCTYTNTQRNSLIIRKEHKDKSTAATNDLLGGAGFTISPNPTTGVAGSSLVVQDISNGGAGNDVFNSNAGLICIDNVVSGVTFTITETTVPANHQGAAAQSSIGSSLGTCASRTISGTPNATFINEPLTTITVSTNSLAGTGVTESTVQCTGEAAAVATPHTTGSYAPGTVTCTIIIDP